MKDTVNLILLDEVLLFFTVGLVGRGERGLRERKKVLLISQRDSCLVLY